MGEIGKKLRMRRFFTKGKTVIVPMDHPLYLGPVKGLEDPVKLVEIISKTEADGIIVSPGTLKRVQSVIGNLAVVLRIDGTHTKLGSHLETIDLITTVEHAISVGVDMVALDIYCGADNESELLQKLGFTATECSRYGLPLIGEMIPVSALSNQYAKGGSIIGEDIKVASRVGAEIGADIIKTRYTGALESFKEVISTATVPVIVAGGPKTGNDRELLTMVKDGMEAGAVGLCMGRHVWQHKNPKGILEALCAIVHQKANVQNALKLV